MNNLGLSGLLQKSDQSELGWELKPNLDTFFKLSHFRTNSQGLRDHEHSFQKPENEFRIAIVGDSFSMPSGVEIEDSYHQVIEQNLNAKSKDMQFEFINFAVGGYSLSQYLGIIKHRALKYDPDLIMIGFCPENDEKVPQHLNNIPFKEKQRNYPFYHSFVMDLLKPKLIRADHSRKESKSFSIRETNYMKNIFSQMGRFSTENNIPIVVVFLSNKYSKFQKSYSTELKKIVTEFGLQYTDVSTAFKNEDLKKFQIYPTDYHPNKAANLKFANKIYRFLYNELKLNSAPIS